MLASVNNLTDTFTKMGASGAKAGEDTAKSFRDAGGAIDDAKKSTDELKDSTDGVADASSKIGDNAKKSGDQIVQAVGGIIPITEQASNALNIMNQIIAQQGSLANVSLDQAKFLLTNLGALAGAQTEVLTKRIQDLEAAAEKAQEVAQQMADQASDIQDQIDEFNGNDEAIEDRRHEKSLDDIKTEAEKNNTLNTAAYQNLIKLEDQLHALKLAHIKEQQDAANTDAGSAGSGSGSSSSSSASPSSAGLAPTQQGGITLNIHLPPGTTIIGNDLNKAGEQLAAPILKQLQAIQARSRVNIITNKAA